MWIRDERSVIRMVWVMALAMALCQVGCASSTMRTARQLEAGDVVLSGSLDELGTLYIPRANVQAMYGLGGVGDVSVHGGSSGYFFNGGLGGRYYISSGMTLEVQADLNAFRRFELFGSSGDGFTFIYGGSMRLSSVARRPTSFYGAAYLGAHALQDEDRGFMPAGLNAGGAGGVDILLDGGWGLQIEARFAPFYLNANGRPGVFPYHGVIDVGEEDEFAGNTLFVGQLGISLYKRIKTRPVLEPSQGWSL